jgi:hypothetical protein
MRKGVSKARLFYVHSNYIIESAGEGPVNDGFYSERKIAKVLIFLTLL